MSSGGIDLASSKFGQYEPLLCAPGQQVTLNARTIYVGSPLGCSGGGLPCGTADAIVVEWKNWYPTIIQVNNSGGPTTTALCVAEGQVTIGVKVEERYQYCSISGCQSAAPAFPVVTAAAQVESPE
ncbi:MAG: hypothetical protein Kow001_07810 [Acidobacteriota bacterium]